MSEKRLQCIKTKKYSGHLAELSQNTNTTKWNIALQVNFLLSNSSQINRSISHNMYNDSYLCWIVLISVRLQFKGKRIIDAQNTQIKRK